MSVTEPVIRQYEAYNAHDLEAFAACFSEDFIAYRPPATTPSLEGRDALYAFYKEHRFNNPALRAEIISRTALGNKVFDHEKIHGLSDEPIESMAVFEVENGLIKTAWFFFG